MANKYMLCVRHGSASTSASRGRGAVARNPTRPGPCEAVTLDCPLAMADSTMGDYERQRMQRIKENEQRMRSLGLQELAQELGTEEQQPERRVQRGRRAAAVQASSRKSARLAGHKPSGFYIEHEAANGSVTLGKQRGSATAVLRSPVPASRAPAADDQLPVDPSQLNDVEYVAYEELRTWRNGHSRKLEIEPYKVCTNRSLVEMVHSLPETTKDLLEVWGLGPAKVERYGEQFLAILEAHRESIRESHSAPEEAKLAAAVDASKLEPVSTGTNVDLQGTTTGTPTNGARCRRQVPVTPSEHTTSKQPASSTTMQVKKEASPRDGVGRTRRSTRNQVKIEGAETNEERSIKT
eukprot:scaffold1618_cov397-Prasinococcus_capsulatus_cf.AAC.19